MVYWIGLIVVLALLIPNVVFACLKKIELTNVSDNKALVIIEQLGRYGSMLLMVFNIPNTYFGFFSAEVYWTYIGLNSTLLVLYWLGWVVFSERHRVFKAYVLSLIPSVLFLADAVLLRNIPLLIVSVCFAYAHITLSLENAYQKKCGDLSFRLILLFYGLAFVSLAFGASFHIERFHPEVVASYQLGVTMGVVCLALAGIFTLAGTLLLLVRAQRKRVKTP